MQIPQTVKTLSFPDSKTRNSRKVERAVSAALLHHSRAPREAYPT